MITKNNLKLTWLKFTLALPFCILNVMGLHEGVYAIDRSHIDSLLTSPEIEAHEIAVIQLTTGVDVDTIAATSILLSALEQEVTHPTSYAMAVHSYLTITGFIQHHYIRGLVRMGRTASDSLYNGLAATPSPLKERFIVALGLMRDRRVQGLLGPLYYKSEDPFVRYKAIEALRAYRDTLNIPVFIDALKDNYYIIKSGYVQDTLTTRHYLIKTEAHLALIDLGYRFDYQGVKYIPIPPEKKQ